MIAADDGGEAHLLDPGGIPFGDLEGVGEDGEADQVRRGFLDMSLELVARDRLGQVVELDLVAVLAQNGGQRGQSLGIPATLVDGDATIQVAVDAVIGISEENFQYSCLFDSAPDSTAC